MAPLFIFGGEAIALGMVKLFRVFRKSFASVKTGLNNQALLWVPVVFILIPYFVFNTGVIFELSRSQTTNVIDMPYSIALSSYRLDLSTAFTQQDLTAADWLSKAVGKDRPVYVDHHSSKLFINQIDFHCRTVEVTDVSEKIASPGYVYLRDWNVQKNVLTFATGYATRQSISFDDIPWFRQIIGTADRVYNNGSAQVLVLGKGHP